MSSSVRRWLVPLVAAGAVLAVITAVWLQRPGASGGEPGPAAGGSGGSQGAGSPPYDGSVPTEPVTPEPALPDPGASDPAAAVPRDLIGVDSYHQYDARRLALNFSNGVPECYGTAGEPRVEESADAVVVTIPRIPPPPGNEDVACIEIALMLSAEITLAQPLGDRRVLDGSRAGSRAGAPVPAANSAYGDGPTY